MKERVFTKFTGEGGYDYEREDAAKVFEIGKTYEIISGDLGRFRSTYIVEGIEGSWNSVLFDIDLDTVLFLLKNDYK